MESNQNKSCIPSKILVVDDEPDLQLLIKQKFRSQIKDATFDFVFAENGIEALAKLKNHPDVDLVLTDINMPEMDGLTLLGKLREKEQDLQVVIISAYGDMKNIRTAMNRGAFDFITKPIDFSDLEITIDKTLDFVVKLKESQKRHDQLILLEQELQAAWKIQESILPESIPSVPNLTMETCYIPMQQIGGDFFDFHLIDDKHLGVIVADVCGHGIPAALISAMVKMAFLQQRPIAAEPKQLVQNLNRLLINRHSNSFVTVGYSWIDLDQQQLVYVNAGHPDLIILNRMTGAFNTYRPRGTFIGFLPDLKFEVQTIPLKPGDRLIMYTDCLFETQSPSGEFFGDERFYALIQEGKDLSPNELKNHILQTLRSWYGKSTSFEDDLTLVIMDWKTT
jgi:phosphoserine phosphatase RsbU/P